MRAYDKLQLALTSWLSEHKAAEARGEKSKRVLQLAKEVDLAFKQWYESEV